jgi:glycosyltransferase involved in cell wall biosynthesis
MKIGIDARFLTHPQPGGFKTYTENLVAALARIDMETEYILYLDRQPGTSDVVVPSQPNFAARVVPASLPVVGLPWREQVALGRQVIADRIDLLHSPCLTAPMFLACPLVITVHDMIWASPQNFTSRGSLSLKRRFIDWYNFLVPRYAIPRASAIITVSHASRNSIVETLRMDAKKVIVTHEAAGSAFRIIDDAGQLETVRMKYGLPEKYILALGAADPRKNIKSLIHAYGLISEELREKYPLVIVWTHHFLVSEISKLVDELGLSAYVYFLRQVPNENLVSIYNLASLFVFPSRYEGFGLPLLEAMSCGVPVVAADNSSIPEIVGDAAILFNAQDVNGISAAMCRVLADESMQARLKLDGLARVARFSWDKCGAETITVFKNVLKNNGPQKSK